MNQRFSDAFSEFHLSCQSGLRLWFWKDGRPTDLLAT